MRRGGSGRRGISTAALAVFAGVDAATAPTKEARWAYAEWADLVRRRSGGETVLVYSQGAGRAAALVPKGDGSLEVAAVLGLRWEPGKLVSQRSLRGLKPLKGGASWSRSRRGHRRAEGPSPLGRHGGGLGGAAAVEGAGSARASAPSTRRRRAASRCTPIRSGGTASAAALGGDVLDFVRRAENLSLPEALQRLDGGAYPAVKSSGSGQASQGGSLASQGPVAADGGGVVLRRAAPAQPRCQGVPGLAGRRSRRRCPS